MGISDGQTESAKQDAFKRAKDGLLAKQLICLWRVCVGNGETVATAQLLLAASNSRRQPA